MNDLVPAHPLLAAPIYGGYQYSYPHKTAYRPFDAPVLLADVWAAERRDALFLYLHVPFCEMRCGFCNLFTLTRGEALIPAYLAALRAEAEALADSLGPAAFARMAIGGGTPTILEAAQLDALFSLVADLFGARPAAVPTSVETSPATATPERLAVLKAHGVDRVSLGVESFVTAETKAMGRPQALREVEAALRAIRDAGIPTLNIDLIYGVPGQTPADFLVSLDAALAWAPEELYLYPLYVRPLTGLGRRTGPLEAADWDGERLAIYRAARDALRARGYEQVSMRMFRRAGLADWGPPYRCAEDGMVGLGAGARSYAGALHYSSDYAVGQTGVRAIIEAYVAAEPAARRHARYGIRLGEDDRRRRAALMALLQAEGLSLAAYQATFGAPLLDHLPALGDLEALGFAEVRAGRLCLTDAGLERSDAIGPWLQGAAVQARMRSWTAR